jgi:RHS repeat-associated protein
VTSPGGQSTSFVRGVNGRIQKVVYPDGGERNITYNSQALPETIALPQGTTLNLSYDPIGREVLRFTDLGESRQLTYGSGDRIETMTDATGITTYRYDAVGRFVGLTYPSGASVRYDRDVLSRVTAVRVKPSANGAELVSSYAYDETGNLIAVTDPNGGLTEMHHDEVGRLTTKHLPNGVTTVYGYDVRDRMQSIVHRDANNQVLASVTYERSLSGEPTKITREDGSYVVVGYDSALRVSSESYYGANDALLDQIAYAYDIDGNRTSRVTQTDNESYSYAAGFRLMSVTHAGGADNFTYDGGGRVTAIDRGGSHRELSYNSDDKVTRVTDNGIEQVSYTYDGFGRRVGMSEGYQSASYLVAPNLGDGYESPQAVMDASGNVQAFYVYAGERPLMRITPSGVEYYLQDAMGSVIGQANGSGASTASIKYDGFGNILSATGASATIDPAIGSEPRFHGMMLDAATGLYYVRARYYDSATGRWLSRDPIAGLRSRPESMNPYVFCYSNPLSWADPEGMMSLMDASIATAITGILATTAFNGLGAKLQGFYGYKSGFEAAKALGETWSFGFEELQSDPSQAGLDLANALDDVGVDDYAAGMGDTLTGIPFTDFSGTQWIRSSIGADESVEHSDAYDSGVLAGIAVQFMNMHPKLPGWLLGKGSPTGAGGLLNANQFVRFGWGWIGRKKTGQFVLRVALGSGKGHRHYDLIFYPRNWIGGR